MIIFFKKVILIVVIAALSSCGGKSTSKFKRKKSVEVTQTQQFLLTSLTEKEKVKQRSIIVQPGKDGWESELWHEKTHQVLKHLGNAMVDGQDLSQWIKINTSSEPSSKCFRPENPREVHDDSGVLVLKAELGGESFQNQALKNALIRLQADVLDGWFNFKQYGINKMEKQGAIRTQVFAQFGAARKDNDFIKEMQWIIDWDLDDEIPRIVSIKQETWQETSKIASNVWFEDRSIDVMGHLPVYHKQLIKGANHWIKRNPGDSGRRLQGVALGDLNGDGWDDVFLPQSDGLPNCVLISEANGSLTNKADELGLAWLDETVSAIIADFDNDGDQDLVVGTSDKVIFLQNRGGKLGFDQKQKFLQEDCSSMAAADFNGDGLLDLFVGNYLGAERGQTVVKPDQVYDAVGGSSNHLYQNLGEFSFQDVTKRTGLSVGASRLALAASWEDFDDDGDQDLYVANDFGRNCLYVNDEGKFTEKAKALGVDDPSTGMSVSWGDPNGDGKMDLVVGNMFSAAGNRVTSQKKFQNSLNAELDIDKISYLARGNTLLFNRPEQFVERSEISGIRNSQWTWSMLFSDINNDGKEDILALNGYITGKKEDDL